MCFVSPISMALNPQYQERPISKEIKMTTRFKSPFSKKIETSKASVAALNIRINTEF